MKKGFLILFSSIFFLTLSACNFNNRLLILNWGEYINEDLVEAFEEEFNVQVVIDIADSNELFYSKIKSGTTVYDLVVPSDYMVEKMITNDLLQEIDYSLIPNINENNPFMDGVNHIYSQMLEGSEKYSVPYFWGTFGLMYNKRKAGLEEALINDPWGVYFNPESRPSGTRVGMYDVSRYAYAANAFYNEKNPNEFSDELLSSARENLRKANFTEWGNDTLKKGIKADNLDLAFVYTGDFLDMLYTDLTDGLTFEDIEYDILIPERTISFMDCLVIPKKARHADLAHKFMNFMLYEDNAYENASVVGYATPLQNTFDNIIAGIGSDDQWLNDWGLANYKYYSIDLTTGEFRVPLQNFEQTILDRINQMVNNVRT